MNSKTAGKWERNRIAASGIVKKKGAVKSRPPTERKIKIRGLFMEIVLNSFYLFLNLKM